MRASTSLFVLIGLAASPLPSIAQTLRPEGRGESQASSINNSLAAQGQNRGAVQQNQFELNALRNSAPQPQVTPPPSPILPPR